jgi:hypothetical protein
MINQQFPRQFDLVAVVALVLSNMGARSLSLRLLLYVAVAEFRQLN